MMMRCWWAIFGIIPILKATTTDPFGCVNICRCNQYIADCKDGELTDIPVGINFSIASLDLSINNFEQVPPTLKDFTDLKYLNLSHNKISSLGHSDFEGLINLERLDFTFNLFHDWKDIHSQSLIPLTKLMFLDFSNNPLRSVPQVSNYFNLDSLEILKLNNCSMKSISVQSFNKVKKLRELHLAHNPVHTVNESMKSGTLKYVDLSRTSLSYIGESVFQGLSVFDTLMLNNNKNLRNLTINSDSLLYLDLSGSNVEMVPSGNLRSVTTLNLQENFLKVLGSNIFKGYPSVLILNLSTNAISLIRDNAFRGLDNLQVLDLSYNKLTMLGEKVLLPTISLVELYLSHNYISSVNSLTSSSLRTLDLSYCEIYEISRDSLLNLPKLRNLSLARNYISALPDSWTADRLFNLDLSNCRIKSINNRTLEQMTYLRKINLSGNRLTTIDPNNFPQVLYVQLEDNQWRCNCPKLKAMYEWIAESGADTKILICDSPENFEGLVWEDACGNEWYPAANKRNKLWWYSIIIITSMTMFLIIVIALRKMNDLKEERLRQQGEERRTQEREAREALQRMQAMQREFVEQAATNAPDARESQRPPSYHDALLMPRLDTSQLSLNGSLHSIASRHSNHGSNPEINRKNKVRRKRRRRKSDESRRRSRASMDDSNSEAERVQLPLESDF